MNVKFSCKNWIKKKERKCSVCKWWPCNNHREHLEIQFDYGGNFPWQRNSRKIDKSKEELGLLYSRQQSWNLKQAITLKHLIMYINLKTYINPKGMIGMPIIGHHVWDHAYGHDNKGAKLFHKGKDFVNQLKSSEIKFIKNVLLFPV